MYENTFDEITEQYYKAIYRYCLVRLNNEQGAMDCTQEVFLILYKKMDKLKLSENIRAWLYRTADNVMKNYRRKNQREISLEELEETSEAVTEDNYSVETPFEGIITKEEYELINSYYIKGETIKELSKRLKISEGAVYQRISRIKARIKKNYPHNQQDDT